MVDGTGAMLWQDDEYDDKPERRWRKSKYWSDICKDMGKYILTGGVAAPFFSIGGAVLSFALFALALAGGSAILYIGYKMSPDEPAAGTKPDR